MENTVLGLALWVWVAILGGLAAFFVFCWALGLVIEASIREVRDIWNEEPRPRERGGRG